MKKFISSVVIIAIFLQHIAVVASQGVYEIEDYIILEDGTILERVLSVSDLRIARILEEGNIDWLVDTNRLQISVKEAISCAIDCKETIHSIEKISINHCSHEDNYYLSFDGRCACFDVFAGDILLKNVNGNLYVSESMYEIGENQLKFIPIGVIVAFVCKKGGAVIAKKVCKAIIVKCLLYSYKISG